MDTVTKAKAEVIWDVMNDSERAGVRIGMFPLHLMTEAEDEGYDSKELCVAIMNVAEAKGGMMA